MYLKMVNTIAAGNIITDGLVVWFDGLRNHTTNSWTDIISGNVLTAVNAQELSSGFSLSGSNSYLIGQKLVNQPNWTVEIVLKDLINPGDGSWAALLLNGVSTGGDYIAITLWNSPTVIPTGYTFGNDPNEGFIEYSPIYTESKDVLLSLNSSLGCVNKEIASRITGITVGSDYDYLLVGCRHIFGEFSKFLKCSVCDIRIYNRILSEEEIKYNQAIMSKRYSMIV